MQHLALVAWWIGWTWTCHYVFPDTNWFFESLLVILWFGGSFVLMGLSVKTSSNGVKISIQGKEVFSNIESEKSSEENEKKDP